MRFPTLEMSGVATCMLKAEPLEDDTKPGVRNKQHSYFHRIFKKLAFPLPEITRLGLYTGLLRKYLFEVGNAREAQGIANRLFQRPVPAMKNHSYGSVIEVAGQGFDF